MLRTKAVHITCLSCFFLCLGQSNKACMITHDAYRYLLAVTICELIFKSLKTEGFFHSVLVNSVSLIKTSMNNHNVCQNEKKVGYILFQKACCNPI